MVYIIDDESSVRRGLKRLMNAHGYDARTFASAREFLVAGIPCGNACIIIDVVMPGMGGLELLRELTLAGNKAPAIFITGSDVASLPESAKRAGAVAFLLKPLDAPLLLDAVKGALRSAHNVGNVQ